MTPDGVGEVQDFMPIAGRVATERHRLVRNTRVVRGTMRFAIEIKPGFNYGRTPHKLDFSEHGAMFHTDDQAMGVYAIAPKGSSLRDLNISIDQGDRSLSWTRTLREGEIGGMILDLGGGQPDRLIPPDEAQRLADDTARFWRDWLARSSYAGRWREMVGRSAM